MHEYRVSGYDGNDVMPAIVWGVRFSLRLLRVYYGECGEGGVHASEGLYLEYQ